MYVSQPFINHSQMEYSSFQHKQLSPELSIESVEIKCRPDVITGVQHGVAAYKIFNMEKEEQKEMFYINCGYTIHSITANGEAVSFVDLNNDLWDEKQIEVSIPPGYSVMEIEYSGIPQIKSASIGMLSGDTISPETIYLRASSIAPYLMGIRNGDLEITLPNDMVLLSDDYEDDVKLLSENEDGTKTWGIEKRKGAYFLPIQAAEYAEMAVETEEISAVFYCPKKQKSTMKEIDMEQVLADVLRYCTRHYGVPSFAEEGNLRLIEAGMPVTGGGGYAFTQTSVMSENSFYEKVFTGAHDTGNTAEVMIHEIVHQWWGLGKNLWDDENSGSGWSGEGLTVYSTYRLIKEKYGNEYAQKNYVEAWQTQADFLKNNFYYRHPEYLDRLPEKYLSRINSSVDDIKEYCIMPLKILKAEQLVGGEEKMDEILKGLFTNRELNPISYSDFLNVCGLTEEALKLD